MGDAVMQLGHRDVTATAGAPPALSTQGFSCTDAVTCQGGSDVQDAFFIPSPLGLGTDTPEPGLAGLASVLPPVLLPAVLSRALTPWRRQACLSGTGNLGWFS